MSLGMNFARRRMMAAKKEPKYVWAVYDFAYVRDEANATTGSFSATRTRTKMAASAYTVNEGGFTLTNPVSTSLQNLQVGQFIVDIGTTSNSTATSGQYLYEVTSKSGSYTTTVNYKRYGVKTERGETELYRVESDTADYPLDGEHDGLWYVMLKGLKPLHVWDVFDLGLQTVYVLIEEDNPYSLSLKTTNRTDIYIGTKIKDGEQSTSQNVVIEDMQQYSLVGMVASDTNKVLGELRNKYIQKGTGEQTEIGYSVKNVYFSETASKEVSIVPQKWISRQAQNIPGKGTATGNTEASFYGNAYPQDGAQGEYWYTYSHSYMAEFDDR